MARRRTERRVEEEIEWEEISGPPDAPPPKIFGRKRAPRAAIELIHHDEDFILFNKPAGMPADPDAPAVDGGHALLQLAQQLKIPTHGLRRLDAVDTGVSGAVRFARNAGAEEDLLRQQRQRRFTRITLAIVRGPPNESDGRIDLEIGADRRAPDQMRLGGPHAKPALTEWTLRDRFSGFALLACATHQERRHQLRIHLQAAGMPLAVDPLYGGNPTLLLSSFKPGYHASRRREERPLLARLSLHVEELRFDHPRTGAECAYRAEPPRDFGAALNQLDKHGRMSGPNLAG